MIPLSLFYWTTGGLLGVILLMVGGIYLDLDKRINKKVSKEAHENVHAELGITLVRIEQGGKDTAKLMRHIALGLVEAGLLKSTDVKEE